MFHECYKDFAFSIKKGFKNAAKVGETAAILSQYLNLFAEVIPNLNIVRVNAKTFIEIIRVSLPQ